MKNLIHKTLAIFTFLLLAGLGAFAQVTFPTYDIKNPSDTSSVKDTVALGAIMPYYVNTDAYIRNSPLYSKSGFKWALTGSGATFNSVMTASAIGAPYFADTLVDVKFATLGSVVISTAEKSSPKYAPTGGCEGNQRDLDVTVIALPTSPTILDADTAQGGCTASVLYTLGFNFSASTAKFPAYVSYTIKAYDINNHLLNSSASTLYLIKNSSDKMAIDKSQLDAVSAIGVRYTITLDKIWDRISSRATNYSSLGVDASAKIAAIMILPSPKTGIIKHIKTL
jgi:hypothetical protein